jgi:Type II secretion system (T2SS), protein N
MPRTRRLTLIGIATFIVCLAVFAPASLVRFALRDAQQVTLAGPTGTLWRGSGELGIAGTQLGRITWSFAPMALLSGDVGFDVSVAGQHIELGGRTTASLRHGHASLDGTLDTALLNDVFSRYDIRIPGTIAIEHLDLSATYGERLPDVRGELKWSGGDVSYRLSGRDHRVTLPQLIGFIDSSSGQPEISVYQVDDKMPLMLAKVAQDGMATVGITKEFTKMLGEPWPGGEPDHAVVLEVGEKLF